MSSFHQSIGNDFAELKVLMDSGSQFLEEEGVDARAVFRINLVLEEMVTNIIKFSYDNPGPRRIEIRLDVAATEVAAKIIDDGHEFNPIHHQRKEPPQQILERETGGLGIYLIKKLLDSITYRREEGRNIIEVKAARKPLEAAT